MTFICYAPKNFRPDAMTVIDRANTIIKDYKAQGLNLTLRQLYYQFVSRGLIANNDREYKKLGSIINDARLAGLVSWRAIEDRTRYLRKNTTWNDPRDIILACSQQYHVDPWKNAKHLLEVWVEKDALVGVVETACKANDVPFFSCRGYTSQTEMWHAAKRIEEHLRKNTNVTILHLGDHDPSGIDMSRDIEERLRMFINSDLCEVSGQCGYFHFRRLALTMEQVDKYTPPPNPAKLTDTRCRSYVDKYGDESWELDALEPSALVTLIEDTIEEFIVVADWNEAKTREKMGREYLRKLVKP